jgi:alkylation response protein AidB-like acyl-CoA dehydrogenase
MVLPTLLKQGTILIHPSFDPLKVLQTIQEYRINGILVAPTMIYASLDHRRFGRSSRTCCWITELQVRACDLGVQLHGGYGYMAEYPIARAWTDARLQRIYRGANEVMLEIRGGLLFGPRGVSGSDA